MARLVNKKYKLSDLNELARQLEAARVNPAGDTISLRGAASYDIFTILESMIDFQPEVAQVDRKSLIGKAVGTALKEGVVTGERLLDHMKLVESEYLKQKIQRYVIVTSLNTRYFEELTRLRINKSSIVFSSTLPKNFINEAELKIIQEQVHNLGLYIPENATRVRIYINARTVDAAVEWGIEALNILRGWWNYFINERIAMKYSLRSSRLPVNSLLYGPVYTIHYPNGRLAANTIWYDNDREPYKGQSIRKSWISIQKQTSNARRRLNKIKYKEELEILLSRYAKALDFTDYEVAYNKLWSVFEHLADSVGNYDRLIQRTLFLVRADERNYIRLLLEHLRDLRNGFVHFDKNRKETMTFIFQLKWCVEVLVRFHLYHGYKFKSIETACQFLDFPADIKVLEKHIANYKDVLAFQKKGNEV